MSVNRSTASRSWLLAAVCLWMGSLGSQRLLGDEPQGRFKIEVESSLDDSVQPSWVILPDDYGNDDKARPLLVSLHSWSADLNQRNEAFERCANERGWVYLFPDFRGANDNASACGSLLAQQDILDAVAYCLESYRIDPSRVYLTGSSGGGHMTMLMVGRHPEHWAAASAWVGISDLAAWHRLHDERAGRYAKMLASCCGGRPGDSPAVDEEYRVRSPLTWLANATNVPLDIAAGIDDGHSGSVPIRHSLEAYNVVANANQSGTLSETEIEQLSRKGGRLAEPQESDLVEDVTLGRAIYLRRHSNLCRITIFAGGHEGIAQAAVAFLAQHQRKPIDPSPTQ